MLQSNYKARQNFSEYLRKIRIALQMNIKDTAELLGVLPHRLSDYERCKILPTPATMQKMTTALSSLGVSAETIQTLEKLHSEAVACSNNRVLGRMTRKDSCITLQNMV